MGPMVGFWEWALTTVLAGIGAGGVLGNELRRHRHPARAEWDLVRSDNDNDNADGNDTASASASDGVRLTNVGDDPARSLVAYGFGCTVEVEPSRLVEVGGEVTVRFQPEQGERPGDAYVVLRWSTARPRRCETRWLPVSPEGWLATRLAEQEAANPVRRHLLASSHRKVPGPESCERATFAASAKRIRRWETDLAAARDRRASSLALERR